MNNLQNHNDVQVLHDVSGMQQHQMIQIHVHDPQTPGLTYINKVEVDLHDPQPQPPGLSYISKVEADTKLPKEYIEIVNNIEPIQTSDPIPQLKTENQSQKAKKAENSKKKKEAIDGQAREIIFKVIKFFESEKQNRGYAYPVENVVKRACAATGLSESTIKRIKRDGIRAEATQTRMTGPKKKRVRKTKVQLDYFQLCALRGIVNSYQVRKEVPTLGKILTSARHELNYCGGKESLRLILLNKLGIKFKKCEKKNKKPPEENPVPQQQTQQQQTQQQQQPMQQNMQPVMQHQQQQQQQQQMQQLTMKPMETQCVYTNMIPPVSY